MDSIEKERKSFEQRKVDSKLPEYFKIEKFQAKFYEEQHDLIVRLSSEKTILRQETDEFYM